MTGIEYPSITIDGKPLVVRFSFAAQNLMARRGLDPLNLNESVGPGKRMSGVNWLKIFSCMVAENFFDRSSISINLDDAPSVDYWALRIDSLEEICKVCNEAIAKRAEAQKLALVPPTEKAS
jgi:hypothetical protein